MKKIELSKKEIIQEYNGLVKYSTNEENVFIYEVQCGWGTEKSIFEEQRFEERSERYKQKSIIYSYRDYINGRFCGIPNIYYSRGTKKYICVN